MGAIGGETRKQDPRNRAGSGLSGCRGPAFKVTVRVLLLRSVAALLVAICSAVAAVIMWRPIGLNFMYVNSGDCVEGCYFTPQPIDGWLEPVTIAVILSLAPCVFLGGVAIVQSLKTRPKPT